MGIAKNPDRSDALRIRRLGMGCFLLRKRELGVLEHAHRKAVDEPPRTTKLYDRTKDEITIGKVERVQL